jgi:hypothetical protein
MFRPSRPAGRVMMRTWLNRAEGQAFKLVLIWVQTGGWPKRSVTGFRWARGRPRGAGGAELVRTGRPGFWSYPSESARLCPRLRPVMQWAGIRGVRVDEALQSTSLPVWSSPQAGSCGSRVSVQPALAASPSGPVTSTDGPRVAQA